MKYSLPVPQATIRFASPHSKASWAVKVLPVKTKSNALDRPIIADSRTIPPFAHDIPSM